MWVVKDRETKETIAIATKEIDAKAYLLGELSKEGIPRNEIFELGEGDIPKSNNKKNVLLVAFCGKMGSGKDYMGEYVANLLSENPIHYSFATPLKDEVNLYFNLIRGGASDTDITNTLGLTEKELLLAYQVLDPDFIRKDHSFHSRTRTPEVRRLLQFWGSDLRRKQDPDYWVKKAKDAIVNHNRNGDFVFVTDARFINEFEAIHELGGRLIYLNVSEEERKRRIVGRDGIVPSDETLNHISERDCDFFKGYDLELKTDGLSIEETQELLRDYFES